jgi:uncharacterized alpha/beta hydrolase family protein
MLTLLNTRKEFAMRRVWILICLFIGCVGFAPALTITAATQTVTLYLHGHHGNQRSMTPLMAAAQRQAEATPALVATVAPDGQVTFRGHLSPQTPRPLVQVLFTDNQMLDYHHLRLWVHNVMVGLSQKYGVRKVNFVAHSLGNTAVLFYLLRWGQDRQLPRVTKWVSIAGNFDGIPGMHMQPQRNHLDPNGRPHLLAPDFRQALLLKNRFPAITVLNLYGDLADGSHSDGRILNASSRALGFLVAGRATQYTEQKIVGPEAQHSQLRLNPQVAARTNQFLWPAHR